MMKTPISILDLLRMESAAYHTLHKLNMDDENKLTILGEIKNAMGSSFHVVDGQGSATQLIMKDRVQGMIDEIRNRDREQTGDEAPEETEVLRPIKQSKAKAKTKAKLQRLDPNEGGVEQHA